MIRRIAALVLSTPLAAQEYVVTDGPLTDVDFYRLVSCASAAGRGCNQPLIRWDKPVVSVTFAPIPQAYLVKLAQEFDRALNMAISQIRSAAPGLNLRRVSKSSSSDVQLFLQPIRQGGVIRGTGYPELDGTPIGAAQMQVFWDEHLSLTQALIVFAADIPLDQVGPIMIEELSQAIGLMTDIRNPYYTTRSVFSGDSNSVIKFGEQDRTALQFH